MFPYQQKVFNLNFLLQSQHWNTEQLRQLQLEGFKAITDFAREHCQYYRDLPKIKELDDIKNIPILTKTDIKKNFDDIHVKSIPHEIEETGGTISRVKIARDIILVQQLELKRFELWYGVNIKRVAHLWGSVEGSKFVEDENFLWMPVEQLENRTTAEKYLNALERMYPDMLHGYARPLTVLAHYANELNIHPLCKVIRSECETLTPAMRKEIEGAFRIENGLFNLYGSRDLGGQAQDCSYHKDLHYSMERYVLEIIDGRFLFTDMINYAFPLIRYENQDVGEWGKPCPCGRGLITVKPLVGRVLNYLQDKNGNWISGFIIYLPVMYYDHKHGTKLFDWVESFQIKQREQGKIIVLLKSWSHVEPPRDLTQQLKVFKGYAKNFDVSIEIVNKIPLSRSGKQLSVDTTLKRWKWE